MSPLRQFSHSSARHPTKIQEIFVGMAFNLHPAKTDTKDEEDMEYTMVLHDGSGVMESETFHRAYRVMRGDEGSRLEATQGFFREILDRLIEVQEEKMMDIRLVAVAEPVPAELKDVKGVEFAATIWLHLDAIPFIIAPATSMFTKLPSLPTETIATSAVQGALKFLHTATHSATTADTDPKDHHVLVDCDAHVRLCSLLQYEQSTSAELWARFTALSTHLKTHKTSIAFFSATPQGGGVALMRHALIRLWRMVGLDVKWYTPEGHPAIFDITKRKIHNVLQGVSNEGEEMDDEDKRCFEAWTEQNYERFWADGAINADLIVIDDPQLSALVPIIKRYRPDAKIIFRSHIQTLLIILVQSALTDNPSTAQHRTWDYLYSFIKDVDLFLAHPVKEFVPQSVRDSLPVLYMAPSTDPLDGLNKPYGTASVRYYRQTFNDLARSQGGNIIDWKRGYICQIGRFDPSKGTDVLLEAYLKFRQQLGKLHSAPADGGPQLIIMGHGSVDDPDGTLIYEQIHETLGQKEYQLVKDDVVVVRAPPSDSILGCVLQGAWVATQLSTREGFEVKVTEAINKRVPIIASDAGGIPLQVKHGENGWIVPTGNSDAVASLLIDIYTGKEKVKRNISDEAKLDKGDINQNRQTVDGRKGDHLQLADSNAIAESFVRDFDRPMIPVKADDAATSEDFWTVGNAAKWMLLASRVLDLEIGGGAKEEEKALMKDEVLEKNVWGMVMGSDLGKGEGVIRAHQ